MKYLLLILILFSACSAPVKNSSENIIGSWKLIKIKCNQKYQNKCNQTLGRVAKFYSDGRYQENRGRIHFFQIKNDKIFVEQSKLHLQLKLKPAIKIVKLSKYTLVLKSIGRNSIAYFTKIQK